jgi:CubicO group peptidase (beta-lactamase class C family)
VVVGRRGAVVFARGYGTRSWTDPSPVSAGRTLYDLASLTKVVATAAAAMVLVDQGRLRLDDPVARYLPEFRRGARAAVTVRDLLTHLSGLPAGRDLRDAGGPRDARRDVLATPLVRQPGERAEYSDVGPIVLGFVIEQIAGEPLDTFLRRTVYRPLGMAHTMFRPSAADRARAAPTAPGAPAGVVHDPAARSLGGVAGNAGLFSTAIDLARFAQMMLNGGTLDGRRVVGDSTVALFTRRTAGWRALGWDTCGGGGSCGHYLGPAAFGHTGFTGTSLWIDPERELFVIVLTNAVVGRPGGGEAPVAILHDVRQDIAEIATLAVTDDALERALPPRLRSDARIGWQR